MNRLHIYLILVILGSMACKNNSGQNSDFHKILHIYFSGLFENDGPGAAILIAKGDEIIFSSAYGYADLNSKEPITTQTLFNLGSISKTFVAYGILILHKENLLSIEDPLSYFFKDFKNPEIGEQVKIKHLLTHTSGLPDIRKVNEEHDFYLTARDAENWAPIMQSDALLFDPGTAYEYSNPAFNALALIIEQVSGIKWQEFIVKKIFTPSGMNHSTITDGPHPESGVAHGYEKINDQWIEMDYGEVPTFAASGNGGVWSSVAELTKYEYAIQNALFIDMGMIEASRTVQIPDNQWKSGKKAFIGWSWFIEKHSGMHAIRHTGTQGGFYSDYVYLPEKKILYIVLANCIYPRQESFYKVLSLL
ncbi:MAG TPA: serine hydrolase domain-containing protein [Saprospiraceae bacterium]|nr:serine hydrolase domain-containing protein [Saprospiraceae bacterium]